MKLYLSSLSLPDTKDFAGLFDPEKLNKIGVIANAWTPYPEEKARPYIDETKTKLRNLKFEIIDIDLLDFKNRENELKNLLQSLQGVLVTGGNTFYLNWAIHQSGFHNIIQELVNDGLIYCGESAGAAVAGPTLHGIENLDDIKEGPEIFWEGLNLVDYGVLPHWGLEKYGNALEACRKEMSEYTTVKTILDDGHIVVSE